METEGEGEQAGGGLTRREALRQAGGVTLAVLGTSALGPAVAVAVTPGQAAFLDPAEMSVLRALVDTLIPPDQDPGGAEAGCADAIDALLGAFEVSPPRIFAGAPFSDRGGAHENHFERFLTLDRYEELGWRLRIEGSKGRRELERNGPVKGWQTVYREGLAALGSSWASQPVAARELALTTASDPAVKALVDVAWPHTWTLMYGAPEYGANRDLAGWKLAHWAGDVQPRGWTAAEITAGPVPGTTIVLEDLPIALDDLLGLAALGASPELAHVLLGQAGDSAAALRERIAPALARAKGRTNAG